MTDGQILDSIAGALSYQKLEATQQQIVEILAYVRAHEAPIYHAIARVLGTCCHCVRCIKGATPVLS